MALGELSVKLSLFTGKMKLPWEVMWMDNSLETGLQNWASTSHMSFLELLERQFTPEKSNISVEFHLI